MIGITFLGASQWSIRLSGLTAAIDRRLRTELSLDCVPIDLTTDDQSQPIAHLLAGFLDVSAVEIGTVADFAGHPRLIDRVLIVDGLERTQLRRWSLFLRQLMAEPAEETVVGPVLLVLLPTGLGRDDRSALCGPQPSFRPRACATATTARVMRPRSAPVQRRD
ncbi:hypothetical protein IVB18_11705 [Bradyrhizobium sp. 186]|uniref:hypothetical protein n=1 Tax=Bradyrhizobium sp. 186 TaxID=2782654 RepID=UPI0020018010|nr:hypothetical protein [Bradyrhizobium sp. 186]UPK37902.1 hypothetical protein IVB18_11705 [Bradyrhizobium sp. 186]